MAYLNYDPGGAGITQQKQQQPFDFARWYFSQMNQANTPDPPPPAMEDTYLTKFAEHLQAQPERKDPGWKRTLLSGLIGGAVNVASGPYIKDQTDPIRGAQYADQLLQTPYQRSMADWATRGHGLEQLSEIESKRNRYGLDSWEARMANADRDRTREQNMFGKTADIGRQEYEFEEESTRQEAGRASTAENARLGRDAAASRQETATNAANERARLQREAVQGRFDKTKEQGAQGREVHVSQKSFNDALVPSINDWLKDHPEDNEFVNRNTDDRILGHKPPPENDLWTSDASWKEKIARYKRYVESVKKMQEAAARKKIILKSKISYLGGADEAVRSDDEVVPEPEDSNW